MKGDGVVIKLGAPGGQHAADKGVAHFAIVPALRNVQHFVEIPFDPVSTGDVENLGKLTIAAGAGVHQHGQIPIQIQMQS